MSDRPDTVASQTETIARLTEAIRQDPARPESHFRLAHALQSAGDAAGTLAALHRTLALVPSFTGAWNNLGVLFAARGRLPASATALRRVVAADPDSSDGWNNLGNVHLQIGDAASAVAFYRRASERAEAGPIPHANLINAMHLVDGIDAEAELAECRRFASRHAAALDPLPTARPRDPDRRLTIGYVGADTFRFHTASRSILPLVEAHDRREVEVVLFSDTPPGAEDEITARYRAAGRLVPTFGLSDAALAESIAREGVDIAVDVVGYPRGSRLLALARRPAPVQVNLLLMSSFGMEAVGWAIGDAKLTPPGSESRFSERLIRIDLAFVFDPLQEAPKVSSAPGASGSSLVFASLNQASKLSLRCIAAWARILAATPNSRLLLKGRSFTDAVVAARIRAAFAHHGIDGRRLDLRGWTATQASHLDTYRKVDIALDPFPYGGVITTCEALWMGVPVVSLEGDRVLGRYGSTFLRSLDLGDLVANDESAYVDIAVDLARNRARLAELRTGLRPRLAASRLCDGAAFARAVEGAYREMWSGWCGSG
ncbi:MAG: tetratricopeptide repeat protein [Alphaproteobacteria bacterium]|nr:tetratricopeptide repeat protein [Alphaproteobacteria bacterium]